MPVHNKEIASILNEVADLLNLKGENQFRIRAYRNAARVISDYSKNIADEKNANKNVSSLPGIGDSMVEKIGEIIEHGKLKQLEQLKKEIPGSLIDIMNLEQIGPQKARKLYESLNIKSINDLKKAARDNKIKEIEGFGQKTQESILREINEYQSKGKPNRFKWNDARDYVTPLVDYLNKKCNHITVAGSYRRKKETVGDIDILATSKNTEEAMNYFTDYDETVRVIAKGKTKSSIKLRSGLQIDLRLIDTESYGAALLYFTGSKEHNVQLRKIGQKMDFKINEYGVYKNDKKIAGKTEKEVYKKLSLPYIEPELRENRGEIDAAQKNKLPKLIKSGDIKGDLHTHTNATDGKYSMEEMIKAAQKRKYEYFAITDHSKKVSMANGLDKKRLARQIEKIDHLKEQFEHIHILKSIEVDILEDGTLDLPDDILKELDLVVASVHYNRKLSRKKQTNRILKAMENPYLNILGHPSGRLINERPPIDMDMEKIIENAIKKGCFLELNAYPDRLDLDDTYLKYAKENGLKIPISTDAHSTDNLDYMELGVAQARRGWLEKKDVINTYSWSTLKKMLKRK